MSALLCFPGRIEGAEAARYFARARWGNLFGLLARPVRVADTTDPSSRVPHFVERLWMPAYAVCLRTLARQIPKLIWTSVDGWGGQFSLFDAVVELTPLEPVEDSFAPNLDETEAVVLARRGMMRYILLQRGQTNKPTIEAVEEVKLYHFPVWVCYVRRRNHVDLSVMDGCTGKSAGAKMRVALINALVAARKAREAQILPHG